MSILAAAWLVDRVGLKYSDLTDLQLETWVPKRSGFIEINAQIVPFHTFPLPCLRLVTSLPSLCSHGDGYEREERRTDQREERASSGWA